LLVGCASVGPDFVAPAAPTISRYTADDPVRTEAGRAEISQRITSGADVPRAWWRTFRSPALDTVVELALSDSPTLQTAQATLAQANEVLRATQGGRYPQVAIDASAVRGNQGSGRAAGVVNSSSAGPVMSYELDAFGATARRIEQADALTHYQRAQVNASVLTLSSSVVLQVISLASALEQTRAVQDIIAADERNLELVRISATAGRSAGLDVLTAESQLASDRTLLPPLLQQASTARHALAVLVGKASSEWTAPDFDFVTLALPPDLPLSLPSELVHRRPDIQAAEALLHAANAAIGIATAQLYPSITLTASWTAASIGGTLFSNASSIWEIAAGLVAPVFNGGALKAQRAAAVDAYAAQLGIYQQTVLLAFGQVADALQALSNGASLIDAQRRALDAAQATLDLTQQSYQAGQTSFLQIIEAQRLYQRARLGYVLANSQRYIDSVQLIVAMGGAAADTPR
jgi:NodT family efflux transporter outer membrane factor (OMF) lipoprotein